MKAPTEADSSLAAGEGGGGRRSYPFQYGRDSVITYPVTAAGVTTRVVEAGSEGDVLVCLHGAGSRADRFTPMMPSLVKHGYHVFAIDFPGHGVADKRAEIDYTGAGLAAVVEGVLCNLGLAGVTLVGTSLGGHIAAWVAAQRADLVKSVVLIGAVGVNHFPERFQTPIDTVADGSVEGVRRKLGFLVSDETLLTDAWVREESMINTSTGAREALQKVARYLNEGVNGERQDARLKKARPNLPVLLVWGSDDKWTPLEMGREAQENLPGSVLEVMADCGHAPYFEDPDGFVDILLRHRAWLQRATG
ncbi:alpha/beta hydrolase [Streptomyces sp. NPDC004237]|uniref:alpha/beta fold hydrolase n=1 Tax=Streptomyces sp. NPDC004237 TaxID=3154455 RepID=UPI0033A4EA61